MLDTGYSMLDDLPLRTNQNVIEYRESNIEYPSLPGQCELGLSEEKIPLGNLSLQDISYFTGLHQARQGYGWYLLPVEFYKSAF